MIQGGSYFCQIQSDLIELIDCLRPPDQKHVVVVGSVLDDAFGLQQS